MFISFDGACKGNGTPECMSVGACVTDALNFEVRVETLESTNQRGELNGAIEALKKASIASEDVFIVTDSEFIFNSINKEWCLSWPKKGWLTSMGDPIKNQDQWNQIVDTLELMNMDYITMIYVKGHVLPYTKLQAQKDMGIITKVGTEWVEDHTIIPDIAALHAAVSNKFDTLNDGNCASIAKAKETMQRINGYSIPDEMFKKCVCLNIVTDLIAGLALDKVVAPSK